MTVLPTRAPAAARELLQLRPGVVLDEPVPGSRRLRLGPRGTTLTGLADGVAAAIDLLAAGPIADDELIDAIASRGNEMSVFELPRLVQRLRVGGWLSVTIAGADGCPLVVLRPLGPQLRKPVAPLRAGTRVLLSRFAVLRRDGRGASVDGGGLVVESPLAHVVAEVRDPAVIALLGRLAAPTLVDGVPEDIAAVIAALRAHGFVHAVGEQDDAEFRYAQWGPHELWFHSRSRMGRHDLPFGGTYPGRGKAPSPPAVPPPDVSAIALPTVDMHRLMVDDMPLTAVLERRSSTREHNDAQPLTAAQLGEFLQRCARVRAVWRDGDDEVSSRPYPNGGARYELELYPVITSVAGVAPGLHHYDAVGHRLERIEAAEPAVARLVELARVTALMPAPPQVLIVIAARFGRVMWKYESMGYALVLKHVGVLYQVMYSVATAMGLAACGLGGGDADAFAAATGRDYLVEGSVGEFVLGSRPGHPGADDGLPA